CLQIFVWCVWCGLFFFFKQKTAYEIGLGIPAEPLFRSATCRKCLHFHAVHFMRTLPTGSVDPNFGRRVRNRRQLNSLQNTWPYEIGRASCRERVENAVGAVREKQRNLVGLTDRTCIKEP